MEAQKPTVGRIVQYRLTEDNALAINRRRTTGREIADRIKEDKWPLGAQAHIGNTVSEGDVLPMVICKVWDTPNLVNGQVLLDGNDQFWTTSVGEGTLNGEWCWPPRN